MKKQHYGFDGLNLALVLLALAGAFICPPYGFIASALFLGLALFRALSTNLARRNSEALWLRNRLRGLKSSLATLGWRMRLFFHKMKASWNEFRHYKKFKCKNCGQKLRVPRGKGRIRVTCRSCQAQFSMKS